MSYVAFREQLCTRIDFSIAPNKPPLYSRLKNLKKVQSPYGQKSYPLLHALTSVPKTQKK
jgi:hypothetical protein